MTDFFDDLEVDSNELKDRGAGYIDEGGAYVGIFHVVAHKVAKSGAKGVRCEFSGNGDKARFDLWLMKADGTIILRNKKYWDMIQTVLSVRAKAEPGKVQSWDEETKGFVEVDGHRYTNLENKPIGLIFEQVIEEDGKNKFEVVGVFHAQNNLTADEILKGVKEPKAKAKIIKGLRVIDKRPKGEAAGGSVAEDFAGI